MDCAAEETVIRRAMEPIVGVRSLTFRLRERTLTIDAEEDALEAGLTAIRRAGFEPLPIDRATATAYPADETDAHGEARAPARTTFSGDVRRLALALGLALAAESLNWFGAESSGWKVAGLAFAAIAIWQAGFDVVRKGLASLRRGRLDINGLMSIAVIGAFLIGQWPEAAMVMALYAVAELIEARAVDRARSAIAGLMALAPDAATVQQTDGRWREVPVAGVRVGARVRVGPGERIPLDAFVIDGQSAVDQAPVTGESIPIDKAPGDAVFAGTINQTGTLECEVTAAASSSTLARIIDAVERAQGSRAPTQRFVDRFSAAYTPGVFMLALLVAIVGPLLFGWSVLGAIYKALVLLVIACPCALVISTPVTLVSGLTAAARRGILIKGGVHLEHARQLKAIGLDKTGTITEGKPRLVKVQTLDPALDRARAEHIAAALAGQSDHPVSRAISAGLISNDTRIEQFKALTGRGVEARIGGEIYVLGNHRLIEDRGQCSDEIEAVLHSHEQSGRTVSLLANDRGVVALFVVADTIKSSSADAIDTLRRMGVTPVMLSGDNRATAEAVAREAGVHEVRGDLLPEEKLNAITQMQKSYGATAMVGDGINDAPALARADIGIAMGGVGTDIAMEAADVVVMNDDLRRIPELVKLSRHTHAVLWQNIALALGIKGVFLMLALFGDASMWMAVFADMGASLLVVGNGLRLLRT